MAVSDTDKLDLFLLVGGEEPQKLIETLPEHPTNYESHIQKLNNQFEAHRNNTLELYKFFNIYWPTEVPFADFETKCREQGATLRVPDNYGKCYHPVGSGRDKKWRAAQCKILFAVYCLFIRYILEYMSIVLINLPQYLPNALENIQKSALGILVPSMSYNQALHLTGLPSLLERRESAL